MNLAEPHFSAAVDPDFAATSSPFQSFDEPHLQANSSKISSHFRVFLGLIMIALVVIAFISLATWSVNDPSFSNANGKSVANWVGHWGASFADIMIQFLGLGAAVSLFPPAMAAWLKIMRQPIGDTKKRWIAWFLMLLTVCAAFACLSVPQSWPLPSSLGGLVGDTVLKLPALFTGEAPSGSFAALLFAIFCIPSIALMLFASGIINRRSPQDVLNPDLDDDEDDATVAFGALSHWYLMFKARFRKKRVKNSTAQTKPTGLVGGSSNLFGAMRRKLSILLHPDNVPASTYEKRQHQDPSFTHPGANPPVDLAQDPAAKLDSMPQYGEQIFDTQIERSEPENLASSYQPQNIVSPSIENITPNAQSQIVQQMAPAPKQSTRITREAQTSLFSEEKFELPSLHFLGEPKALGATARLNDEELEQNARLLEGVLSDFGVKGQILNVRPGPVVTLYELEPAPGIKSSRVIGLADDIARSMSAIAARVAVIPGRNAIGIELPNHKRETVYLRETLSSQVYENSKASLPLILGKNIGGEPIIADLAKMPHLLVAGTTGSGKSVAINTMILSILYRLSPDQVKMIMIDPKMLELSIYDGIPHLLTPVVTDPKKAVVALKWTVREMEERYKNMSKLGVRNIDGYNARLKQAAAKGEAISKTVQTGFDRETGEAIYETEQLDLTPMPYIVVIIDEMADLMMVAGKDIEGTVQRLAQMARAAGIHVVMATQRPSVDVITGTIKANFPTRISFQVTSKIDSRTILGEQGAEQLLGMGDMLYMAGGGRITRVHGPFVDDGEVERVVTHLKTQGTPQYLESVTKDDEDAESAEGSSAGGKLADSADIYDQAVAIVLRDRKVSTSYIQRRLSIGYNRAASLIERMEQESLISAANHAGKREILVPGEDETI